MKSCFGFVESRLGLSEYIIKTVIADLKIKLLIGKTLPYWEPGSSTLGTENMMPADYRLFSKICLGLEHL